MDIKELEHPDKWAVNTFGIAELGADQRHTERLVKMVIMIAEHPSVSLPESIRNWSDTLAFYCFAEPNSENFSTSSVHSHAVINFFH